MTKGRCAGCGMTDNSCKKVQAHVVGCPEYLELFKTNPDAALSPELEYERHKLADTQEARDEARTEKFKGFRAHADNRLQQQHDRWTGAGRDELLG